MDEYLKIKPQSPVYGDVPGLYRQQILQDSARVFKDDQGSVDLISWSKNAKGGLHPILSSLAKVLMKAFSIIRQKYTWDNLFITRDLLFNLLNINRVFFPFLDCVQAFGFRKNDDDEVWEGCHRACEWDPNCTRKMLGYGTEPQAPKSFKATDLSAHCFGFYTEIAYTFRYVINNGRTEGSPWSVRQTAVYQKTNLKTGCSIWILIQPNEAVLEHFKALCLQSVDGTEHSMAPHLAFLSSARVYWKAYIGQLRLSLQELDEKACFSRVGKAQPGDYNVSISDGQQLQKIRHKLDRSMLMLGGILAIIKSCKTHCADVERAGSCRREHTIRLELSQLINYFNYCKTVIRSLKESSNGTADLLKQICDFYLTDELRRSSKALEASMVALEHIAAAARTDNGDMLQLARYNREDTINLKTLTRITIVYLPGSLIATIFSSNLISFEPLGAAYQPSRMVVSRQFWIYVIVTLGFTVLTLCVSVILERRRGRRCP
ncbi:hypothetical protein JMJ35_003785 [Cladonia borealis]|uniref:CorA-like transporter domain-containing protein n=1 Tax=Cladonia borealis TaxID=184061 RepID=A0AA39V303_9LECA|nr:hypothetical protein JMJ35_003785 [Cladonia borealis]